MLFGSKPTVSTDEVKIDELLERSVVEAIPSKESFKKLLLSGKQLRIKLGIDPTSPNLHLGRSVPLLKMRDFQELGHQLVSIVGDFTGIIGDTSDKDAERPMLDDAAIATNKKDYFTQIGKVVNLNKVEKRYNSEWLSKLTFKEIGEQADQFSVADFISRELIKKRLDEGKRVSLRETLYPLMQGYDSVAVNADVELGATDQRFNLLAGRTLQGHYKQEPQHILILGPLIPGTDGRKMSSSWGNVINLTDTPADMFGKVMSISDDVTEQYLVHCTRIPFDEVEKILIGHPKDAKVALAEELVRMYHNEDAAQKAKENFENTFAKGHIPEDVAEVAAKETILETLVAGSVVSSNSEVRRLVSQGAITHLDSEKKITDFNEAPKEGVYKIGKHRFVKVVS